MKKNILVLLPFFFLGLSSFFYPTNCLQVNRSHNGSLNKPSTHQVLNDVIMVGHRTSDSTSDISISSADIQQNIIATIPELDSTSITNDPVAIKVNNVTGYLLFNVTNAAGVKMTVGLELIFNASDLVYPLKAVDKFIFVKARVVVLVANIFSAKRGLLDANAVPVAVTIIRLFLIARICKLFLNNKIKILLQKLT